jgi:tRNA A-37 threonylcarbamoyl transferase component Bud32
MSVGGFGTAVKLDRQQEEAFMAQKPPALDKDVIRSVQLYLDGGNDMVFKFQNGERRYALVVILQDHKSLGWKECQALADAMKVAQRGTLISNTSFDSVVAQLKQKYGSVKDPVVERGRLVSLVCPGRGDVRHTVSDVISHVRVSFDADGDLVVKAHTYSSQAYVLILQLPTAKQTFFREDCRAFIDVMTMLETGDRMEALTFVSLCGVLRVKYNFCTLHKKGDVLHGAVLASRVKNSAPVDSVMVKAMQAKKDELEAGAGAGSDGGPSGLPRCPYRGMSYLRALQESGQAQVYAGVVTSTGQKVAIKVFKGEADRASETYRTELRMLLKMSEHRNVIEVLEFFENPEPALVTRLIEGEGDMMAYIAKHGRFEEREARRICAELGEGIAHLHKAGIVHRDLKTPNVLLQQSASTGRLRPIVIDLGLGSAVRKGSTSTTMTMAQLVSSFAQTNVSAQTDGTKVRGAAAVPASHPRDTRSFR